MKKTIFSVMFAMILGSAFVSCGNKGAAVEGAGVDSTLVDSVDTVLVDTVGVAMTTDSVCAE